MAKPREAKLDFLRNVGGCTLSYLRAGNDKTALEESLMLLLEYTREEIRRLGLANVSSDPLPSGEGPESKPKPKV